MTTQPTADAPPRLPPALDRSVHRQCASPPEGVRRAHLTQEGELRLKPGGPWRPFRAEQTVATGEVAFGWRARVRMAPLVTAVVEDAFEDGQGRLTVKLWGILPIARAMGPEIDQGQVQRYLAELAWNPLALRHNTELRFGAGEDGGHRVWWGDPRAHVDLHLDDAGQVVRTFTRTRPRDGGDPAPWEGRFADYADIGGLWLPRRGEVAWLLPGGRFDCWRGVLTSYSVLPGA